MACPTLGLYRVEANQSKLANASMELQAPLTEFETLFKSKRVERERDACFRGKIKFRGCECNFECFLAIKDRVR